MTNEEHKQELLKSITVKMEAFILNKINSDSYFNLIVEIAALKFRTHYPGSLSADDYERNDIHYSWYMKVINSVHCVFDLNTREKKEIFLKNVSESNDVVVWFFNNVKCDR